MSRRTRAGWLLFLALVVLGAAALALTVADFIAYPRDIWAALLFAAGGLFGWALDRATARDKAARGG